MSPDEETRERNTNPDLAEQRQRVDEAGIQKVVAYEESQGRRAEIMPHNNEGFDLKSFDTNEKLARFIEVKSISGKWDQQVPVLSAPQFIEHALEKGERYWLYVVEYADQDNFVIHRIQNPAQQVTGYAFDKGWMALREDDESNSDDPNHLAQ